MDTQRQVGFKLPGESSVQFAVRRTLQNAEEVATAVAEAQRRAKEAEDHAKFIEMEKKAMASELMQQMQCKIEQDSEQIEAHEVEHSERRMHIDDIITIDAIVESQIKFHEKKEDEEEEKKRSILDGIFRERALQQLIEQRKAQRQEPACEPE